MSSELANALKDLSAQARELASRLEEGTLADPGDNGEIVNGVERLAMLLSRVGMKGFCERCDRRDTCRDVCAEAKRVLPGVTAGRRHGEILCESLDAHPRAERISMERDIYTVYRNHVHLLTRKQRQVVELYHGEGQTHAEIAEIIGVSRVAVTERLARARKTLQQALTRHSPTFPDDA